MSLQGIQLAISSIVQGRVIQTGIANVPAVVYTWIAANPRQSALLLTNGALIFTPAVVTAPLLSTMGFAATGPVAGE